MVVRQATRSSAFNGVANMTIRFMLQAAFILYSHNALLCPPKRTDRKQVQEAPISGKD